MYMIYVAPHTLLHTSIPNSWLNDFNTTKWFKLSCCINLLHLALQVLRLHRSNMEDEECRMLVNHLLDHPSLLELDLSHNLIGDRGARAIGKLLNRSCLETLNMYNNQISGRGAQALAHALSKNTSLVSLNLRLNQLGDEGGQAIAHALLKNQTLVNLHLGGNEMTEPTASAFSQVLVQNKMLRSLNLSCNKLGTVSSVHQSFWWVIFKKHTFYMFYDAFCC